MGIGEGSIENFQWHMEPEFFVQVKAKEVIFLFRNDHGVSG